jgi:hypothetical protein
MEKKNIANQKANNPEGSAIVKIFIPVAESTIFHNHFR